jgi:hypothetical protein
MKCRRPLNVAEHHSICEMAENTLVLGVDFTSQGQYTTGIPGAVK